MGFLKSCRYLLSLMAILLSRSFATVLSNNDGDMSSGPLNMEVEWVLQGRSFTFTGFMIEFLGLIDGFVEYLPQLKITQSSFKYTFEDSPVSESYLSELFPKEAHYLKVFMSDRQPKTDLVYEGTPKHPVSHFFGKSEISLMNSSLCREGKNPDLRPSPMRREVALIGGDLNRHRIYEDGSDGDAETCCLHCLAQPICIGWNFSPADGCSLKRNVFPPDVQQVNSTNETYSGVFVKSSALPNGRMPLPRAQIFHGTTCFYRNDTIKRTDANVIWVGRFMMEREEFKNGIALEEFAVSQCAAKLDEIWVPTEWHRRVFTKLMRSNGVPSPNVAVIEEAVDTTLFDPFHPDISRKGYLSCPEDTTMLTDRFDLYPGDAAAFAKERTKTEGRDRFEFLSIFKWEHRKGWDLLLSAYWSAFNSSDNVLLRLRTYIPSFDHGGRNITKRMEDFAMEKFGKELRDLAPVVIEKGYEERPVMAVARGLDESGRQMNTMATTEEVEVFVDHNGGRNEIITVSSAAFRGNDSRSRSISPSSGSSGALSREAVRDLLASADAFVLPTRGEGWGLPIAEAMSMALPVIVTDSPGPRAYTTHENAYIIPLLTETETDSQGFVLVDEAEFRSILIRVVDDHRRSLLSSTRQCLVLHNSDRTMTASGGDDNDDSRNSSDALCCWRPSEKGTNARRAMQQITAHSVVGAMVGRLRNLATIRGWKNI